MMKQVERTYLCIYVYTYYRFSINNKRKEFMNLREIGSIGGAGRRKGKEKMMKLYFN